jgi:cytoskeletal protein RodZ
LSVGGVLLEARERAGLSVAELSERTCIRRTLIEQIEHDEFDHCGGDVYARGHVKSIAQALHIDPAPLLVEFDGEHHDPEAPTASGVLDPEHLGSTQREARRPRPNWSAAMAVALAVVLAVGGYQALTGGGDSSSSTSSSADAGDAGVAQASPNPPSDAAGDDGPTQDEGSAGSDEGVTVADGVTVVLSVVDGKSWVSATGKRAGALVESVLGQGQERTLRDDRQLDLVVGNAGAVRLSVNGRDLGSPGGEGEVVRLKFGPGDPADDVTVS